MIGATEEIEQYGMKRSDYPTFFRTRVLVIQRWPDNRRSRNLVPKSERQEGQFNAFQTSVRAEGLIEQHGRRRQNDDVSATTVEEKCLLEE